VHEAVRANVRTSVRQLRHGSEIIERMSAQDGLLVVGAEYSLETGEVDVFEGLEDSGESQLAESAADQSTDSRG
jgi:carbonic anhydrase